MHKFNVSDRGIDDIGDKLTSIAQDMGEKQAYRGDDGDVHIE